MRRGGSARLHGGQLDAASPPPQTAARAASVDSLLAPRRSALRIKTAASGPELRSAAAVRRGRTCSWPRFACCASVPQPRIGAEAADRRGRSRWPPVASSAACHAPPPSPRFAAAAAAAGRVADCARRPASAASGQQLAGVGGGCTCRGSCDPGERGGPR